MRISEIFEKSITKKAQEKAEQLGVEFKVKHTVKEGMDDFLVRIKRNVPKTLEGLTKEEIQSIEETLKKQSQFANHIADIIVPKYAYNVRFTYPSKL